MRDHTKFTQIIKAIELRTCHQQCDCYRKDAPALVYCAGEKADTVLISESPWDLPKRTDVSIKSNIEDLNESLKNARDKAGKSAPIHSFILRTFEPLFEKAEEDLATPFLESVYWTHVGKKSFKDMSNTMKWKGGEKCARKLLIEELSAVEPSLLVTASSIATSFLFGCGFMDLLEKHREVGGKLLRLTNVLEEHPESLLAQSTSLFSLGWTCELAALPNPSGKAGPWRKEAEKNGVMQRIVEKVHEYIAKTPHLNERH